MANRQYARSKAKGVRYVAEYERRQIAEALERDRLIRLGRDPMEHNIAVSSAEYERGMVRKALEAKGRE